MTVLVPGLHLLDDLDETFACAGLMRQLSACAAADMADPFEVYVLAS